MYSKFLLKFLPLSFLLTVSCFAEIVEVSTNEPDDTYLGMKIDMYGRDFLEKITVDNNRFLLINQLSTDVRVGKDPKTNLNHFNALIPYKISDKAPTRYLYLQCPIVREFLIDRTRPVITLSKMDSKQSKVSFDGNTEIIKEELVDPGFYKFLVGPNDSPSKLSNNFPMTGKVSEHFDMKRMCAQIEITHAIYMLDESNRSIVLKRYGLL